MRRPRKITDEKLPRLIAVAQLRLSAEAMLAHSPVNKQLAHEIGVTPAYLHNVMHRMTTILRISPRVPNVQLRRALFSDREFAALKDKLQAKVKVITLPAAADVAHSQE